MSDKELYMGVTDILSLVGVSLALGTGIFLREVYDELSGDKPDCPTLQSRFRELSWILMLFRLGVRLAGSTTGAWIAAVAWNMANLGSGEWLVIGVGGAMGWKFVDAVQGVFVQQIFDIIKNRK